MKLTKVLFIWKVRTELQEYLKYELAKLNSLELIFPEDLSEINLLKKAAKADVIVGWRPTKELLQASMHLKLFINPGAGVQHLIPVFKELSNEQKVVLVNGHGNAYFTAQHGVALLLALTNKIVQHHNWMQAGRWRLGDSEASTIPLQNRKIGFLGYGHVNKSIHKMLLGFDVSFCALKRNWQNETLSNLKQYTNLELPEFLRKTDILICSVPLTSQTNNMISKTELQLLGKNSLLVNLSRGAVINEEDLYNALYRKTINGAAIDVWYNYQPIPDKNNQLYPASFPFHNLNNVILSPHRAASPFSDLKRWNDVIENISRLVNGRTDFLNLVDLQNEY